jgi:hypothetical protein
MKENQSAIKATMQFLATIFLTICVMCVGEYGQGLAADEQTTEGWRIWGAFLALFIITLPAAGFWSKQISKLFNIED